MASSISLPVFSAKSSNILNPDGTTIDQSFAPANGSMFRNRIINGNFDIWQRATSQTSSGYGSVDRFASEHAGSTKTTSRQAFTLGQTEVPNNPQYFMRTVVSSVAGAGNFASMKQSIEGVRNFAGQTATLSFWAKADANKNIAVEFTQSFGTGGSPSAFISGIAVNTVPLTTAWQRVIVTVSIPSIAGKTLGTNGDDSLTVNLWFEAGSTFNSRSNSLGNQSGTFDIAQVQIEAGSSATPFEFRPIGTEQILCERYYELGPKAIYLVQATTTAFRMNGWFRTQKRAAPTLSFGTGTGLFQVGNALYGSGSNSNAGTLAITNTYSVSTKDFFVDCSNSTAFGAGGALAELWMNGGNFSVWTASAEL
jgi:hypothetical protein